MYQYDNHLTLVSEKHCEDESHCHRSILRELLAERGASLA
jgi:uncharacterized protein YeaO (DUF488 family)